jgi:glycosyltransferase involved in cell wall biosynthesis
MLSILIPIYNQPVTQLVKDLQLQANSCGVDYEIRCYDDCSTLHYKNLNQGIADIEQVHYVCFEKNQGRSKIRNRLAKDAQYDQLLFLDCDTAIQQEDFIQTYVNLLEQHNIICGGIDYQAQAPTDSQWLRWQYGRKREKRSAEKRRKHPYLSFSAFNLLISKKLALRFPFNESLTQYGHEDTLLGLALEQEKIKIHHIDNPITHIGLENSQSFLHKTEQGLENLFFLMNEGKINQQVKLYRHYLIWKRLSPLLFPFYKLGLNLSQLALKQKKPSLFWLDLYKLCYLLTYKSSK